MTNLADLIRHGWPDAEWVLDPETYEGLVWHGPGEKPSLEEIDAYRGEVEKGKWYARIESRADTELQRGVSVTIDGVTYGIRTGSTALALIGAGSVVAARARAAGTTVTEKVPTDKGVVAFNADGMDALFEATRARRAAVMDRVEQLQAKVSDGSITEADMETGWPT